MASSSSPTSQLETKRKTPYRQIRAHYDDQTVTVYQAYNATIADAAVAHQRLDASPSFSKARMTWIKPSWSWMLYRAGYSYKDSNQERILAIKMKHEHFHELLSHACVNEPHGRKAEGGGQDQTVKKTTSLQGVQVQWDPERTPRLGKLDYRSIQIGIRGDVKRKWVEEWIESIEDVTEKARELKKVIDSGGSEEEMKTFCPEEQVYELPQELRMVLKMDIEEDT